MDRPEEQARGTDPLAVAAAVLGVLAAPVGVVLGVVALVRLHRSRRPGRGLAVTGIVVGAVLTAASLVVVLLAVTAGVLLVEHRQATARTDVLALEVGDCFQDPEDLTVVDDVRTVDCAAPHDNEVVGAYDLPDGEYPGQGVLAEASYQQCLVLVAPDVRDAPDRGLLDVYPLVPTPQGWAAGDRQVLCAVWSREGPREGSLRGSGGPVA